MGSNQNKHGDKAGSEWGSKARKEESKSKKHAKDARSIADSEIDGAPVGSQKRRKKDTRRWCRGKVGLEHDWIACEEIHYSWYSRIFAQHYCRLCSKKRTTRLK